MLQVGDRAPDFELPSTRGGEISLTKLREENKAVVLLFYVLDFTGG